MTTLTDRLRTIGAWTILLSGVVPWFTAGAMLQNPLTGRGWWALLTGLTALTGVYRYQSTRDRRWLVPCVIAAVAGALLAMVSFVHQPPALGPSIGVALCLVGSTLLGLGTARAFRTSADDATSTDTDDEAQDARRHGDSGDVRTTPPIGRVVGRFALGVGLVLTIMIVWPARPGDLSSRADPILAYDEAFERFAAISASEEDIVFEPCASQLMTHGERTEVAVVLFHGLTNCPKQFVKFGQELFAEGANVLILRAPGHGVANARGDGIGDLANVSGLTDAALREYADTSVDIAHGLGEEVRVAGLSMGGVLATWVAQERTDVDRVVAIAPAMTIPGVPAFLTEFFRNLFDKVPNIDLPGASKLDHAYAGETTKGLTATFLMADYVAQSAYADPPASRDVIVVLNPDDPQVDPKHLAAFAARWTSHGETVMLHRLPAAGLPHDVIDIDQPDADPALVYPVIKALLDGDEPPS